MSQAIGRTLLAYHRSWRHIDAENHIVGRLATRIAALLMGKHKPIYDPASDCGDNVIVTNARYLLMTGRKTADKVYYRHSGKPGHLKITTLRQMTEKKGSGEILRRAISGMLPKNKLRNIRLERLKIFEEDNAGAYTRNVVRRYDNIAIATPREKGPDAAEATTKSQLVAALSMRATRQNDTPPVGSLGGLKPRSYVPKPKAPKVKRKKKPGTGLMKIFDSQGRECGQPKWKETRSKESTAL